MYKRPIAPGNDSILEQLSSPNRNLRYESGRRQKFEELDFYTSCGGHSLPLRYISGQIHYRTGAQLKKAV